MHFSSLFTPIWSVCPRRFIKKELGIIDRFVDSVMMAKGVFAAVIEKIFARHDHARAF